MQFSPGKSLKVITLVNSSCHHNYDCIIKWGNRFINSTEIFSSVSK